MIDHDRNLGVNQTMDRNEIYEKLNAYLAKRRLKSTKQRDAIIEAFVKLKDSHVSIEQVLHEARKINPHIGYATAYRTLILLVDAEIANQRHFLDGQPLFELRGKHHDHLICTDCGKITEFKNDMIEKIQEETAQKFGFQLKNHKMELYGLCAACQKKRSSKYS